MAVKEHEVAIAGGGPTGMMLAAELALAGIDVAIAERRVTQELDGSRAGGLHARTIEVLDQRGVAERFLSAGRAMQVGSFAGIPLDISDFPTRHNYGLALWQKRFEEILAEWVGELPVTIYRGSEVSAFVQDESGVEVHLSGAAGPLRAAYLVGCDGGRSLIRRQAGIDFPGWEASMSSIIAEVEMSEEPELGIRRDESGQHGIGRLEDGRLRVVVAEQPGGDAGEPALSDLSRALSTVWGTDFGVHSPTWISRFTDATRQAAAYRSGRVLLAGDAAHIHSPIGGQGLNLGIQDAVNLGWKLAQVVKGTTPQSLLDSYQTERRPIAARALRITMAQTALTRSEPRTDALRETIAELVALDEVRRRLAGMLSGLDIRYEQAEGHPLLGRRIPDLDLETKEGKTRLYSYLHKAKPILLNLSDQPITPAPQAQTVNANYKGKWELPVTGEVRAPTAVLIRPDGYTAWVGENSTDGLSEAVTRWLGG